MLTSTAATTAWAQGSGASVCAVTALHAGWEPVAGVPSVTDDDVSGSDAKKVTISVRSGYIYLNVRENATVKIFTILGQQITNQTLPPGQWRFRVQARGIYILKTEGITRRITV